MKSDYYYYAHSQLLNLIQIDFDNLCESSFIKDQTYLFQRAYKRNSSLKQVNKTYLKYQLHLPHETMVPTIIPFLFMKKITNPKQKEIRRAVIYIETYSKFLSILEILSKDEVKKLFDEITKENVKRALDVGR